MQLKLSSAKWRPFCLGLNVLKHVLIYPWFRMLGFRFHTCCVSSGSYKTLDYVIVVINNPHPNVNGGLAEYGMNG